MIEETDTDIEVRKYDEAEAARMIGFEPYPNLTPKPGPNMAAASIAPLPTNDIDQYFADLGSVVKETVVSPTAGLRQGAQELIDTGIDFLGSEASKFFQYGGFHKTLGLSDEAGAEIYKNMELNTRKNLNDRGFDTELPLKNLQPETEIGIGIREMTAYVSNFLLGRPQFTKVKGLGDSVLDTIGDWGYRLLSNVRANSLGAHALNPEESNLSQLAVEMGFVQELNDFYAEGSVADRMSEGVADRLSMMANPSVRGMELDAEQRLLRKVDTIVEDNAAAGVLTAGIMAAAKAFKTAKAFPKTTGAVVGGAAMAPEDGETAPLSAAGRAAKPAMSTADNMGGAVKTADNAADLDDLGFFSQAQRAAEGLGMDKGTGEQFRSMLKKAGVKDDELKWTGLDVLLAKDRVTKQEIIDHIDANRIELQERELVPADPDDYQTGTAQFDQNSGEVIEDAVEYEHIFQDYIYDLDRIDANDLEDTLPSWFQYFQRNLVQEMGGGQQGQEDAMKLIQRIKQSGYGAFMGADRSVVDEALLALAREEYMNNPLMRWVDDASRDAGIGYEIVGNDDIGYVIRDPDGIMVDTGSDVPYSFNEAMVRAERDAIDTDRIGMSDGGFEEDGFAQHQEYTQFGGDNYREILLSLPRFEGDPDRATIMLPDADQQELIALEQKKARLNTEPDLRMTPAETQRLNELQQSARTVEGRKRELTRYSGGHYAEQNLVVHARVSDRTDNNGKKVLYIEELQSDWGQRGRDDGFFTPGARASQVITKEMNEMYEPFIEELWGVMSKREPYFSNPNAMAQQGSKPSITEMTRQLKVYFRDKYDGGMMTLSDIVQRLPEELSGAEGVEKVMDMAKRQRDLSLELRSSGGLAKGPFVTSTDKWVTVAMKRMLRKAIEEGYDYVAWTPGQIQADRWNNQGLITAYDTVIPKNSQKLVDRIDKGTKLEVIQIDIPNAQVGSAQTQDTLSIPITDAMRNQAPGGMPLFSGAGAAVVGGGAAVSQSQNEQRQMEMQF
jgi:hypothetical protein